MMKTVRLFVVQNLGLLLAIAMFAVLYSFYVSMHPNYSMNVVNQNGNETLALILVSMAQTMPVLLGGLDLSVGPLMTLVNCFGSIVMAGTGGNFALGIIACMALGAACGFMNGAIVVYGRIQQISPPSPPARSISALPCFCGRRRAAISTAIFPGPSPTTSTNSA
jgi:ribose transport system permease protein